jgi:hypothetical protein
MSSHIQHSILCGYSLSMKWGIIESVAVFPAVVFHHYKTSSHPFLDDLSE